MGINIGEIRIKKPLNLGEVKVGVKKVYPELEEIIVTPSVEKQILKPQKYGYSSVTVSGDINLVPENIRNGVSVFGVQGNVKTAKITNGYYLFYNGLRLDSLNELLAICEIAGNASRMFYNCSGPTSLDLRGFNTSQVTTMESMFYNCSELTSVDLSGFNTSQVTSMESMFENCSKLTSVDLSNFNTSQVTTMEGMFQGCSGLTSVDLSSFNTSQLSNIRYMFYSCSNLISLDLSSFDLSNVNNVGYIIYNCNKLENLKSFKNLGKGYVTTSNNYLNCRLDLSKCNNLTHESLMDVVNNLYDLNLTYNVANGGTLYTQSLKLGSTNLAKLTSEEIAIATKKGWTVSS